jgi:hypothetical protein
MSIHLLHDLNSPISMVWLGLNPARLLSVVSKLWQFECIVLTLWKTWKNLSSTGSEADVRMAICSSGRVNDCWKVERIVCFVPIWSRRDCNNSASANDLDIWREAAFVCACIVLHVACMSAIDSLNVKRLCHINIISAIETYRYHLFILGQQYTWTLNVLEFQSSTELTPCVWRIFCELTAKRLKSWPNTIVCIRCSEYLRKFGRKRILRGRQRVRHAVVVSRSIANCQRDD